MGMGILLASLVLVTADARRLGTDAASSPSTSPPRAVEVVS